MCMMLYIASYKELPLVEWNENSHINVKELGEHNISVKCQFTKPHVYYIGSYQGCGCGFMYGFRDLKEIGESFRQSEVPINIIEMAYEEEKKGELSVRELFQYINQNLEDGYDIELYSCWAGNENGIPEQKLEIKLSEFVLGKCFKFEENQFIKIRLK